MLALCRSLWVTVDAGSKRRRAGGLRTSSRVGTLWPLSCCSVSPLCFAGPLACSSDVSSPAAACFCTCCSSGFADKVLLQQVVPKHFPFAGQVLQPLPSGLAGGRAALHCRLLLQSKGAAWLWLQWRRGEELSSVLSVKLMATLLSHPFLCTLPDVH